MVVLDMGEYELPSAALEAAAAAAASPQLPEDQQAAPGGVAPPASSTSGATGSDSGGTGGAGRAGAGAGGGARAGAGAAAAPWEAPAPTERRNSLLGVELCSSGSWAAAAGACAGLGQLPSLRDGASTGGGGAGRGPRVRLYSLLPPALADRAKAWGGELALKPGCRQTGRGFFDAPGAALAAALSAGAIASVPRSLDAMPLVTIVFAAVEGARSLGKSAAASEVRGIARLLRLVLMAALEAAPSGYLCREQEGEMRYMLAFPYASHALQWCMVVQEALMYVPWPAAVLEGGWVGGWGGGGPYHSPLALPPLSATPSPTASFHLPPSNRFLGSRTLSPPSPLLCRSCPASLLHVIPPSPPFPSALNPSAGPV